MDLSNYNLFDTWICNYCIIDTDIDYLYNCYICGKISCNICLGNCLIDENKYFICSNCFIKPNIICENFL